ncbi:helix-turn-helix domain-containing protein [Planococcus rifietoensis]
MNHAIALYHSNRMSVKEIKEATGISPATLYRALKKEKIKDF